METVNGSIHLRKHADRRHELFYAVGYIIAGMKRRKPAFGGLSVPDAELLAAALLGFEHQRSLIAEKMAELRRQIAGLADASTSPSTDGAALTRRSRMSAAARRRIAAAQRKRWAVFHKAKESAGAKKAVPAAAKRAAPVKKWKLTAAGRKRIAEASKKRWADLRAKTAAAGGVNGPAE
jgi:hypothetical protein